MSKHNLPLPRQLYRWLIALLPILAVATSACGTGSSTSSFGY